jgi:alpha-aminoadipate/glutamate carrier protein LysW
MLGSVPVSQNRKQRLMMVVCPKCKSEIDVGEEELEEGELLSCLECDGDFEVTSVEPLKLTKVSDEEETDEDDV